MYSVTAVFPMSWRKTTQSAPVRSSALDPQATARERPRTFLHNKNVLEYDHCGTSFRTRKAFESPVSAETGQNPSVDVLHGKRCFRRMPTSRGPRTRPSEGNIQRRPVLPPGFAFLPRQSGLSRPWRATRPAPSGRDRPHGTRLTGFEYAADSKNSGGTIKEESQ